MADADKLALGLDDIIRTDRTFNRSGGKRGFRARAGGSTAGRGGNQTNGFRTRGGGGLPRVSSAPAGRWKHDLYDDNSNRARGGQRNVGVNSTTKLLLSNLDYGVTTSDVQELFEDVGAVRIARVHYDESGRSLGTAEVIFERRVDAAAAQQKYNGLNLDGRPMDIRLVGGVDDGSQQQAQSNRGSYSNGVGGGGNQRSGFRNNNNQQNGTRGGGNRSRGGKQQQQQQNGTASNGKKGNVTAEDLDAELDAYRAESAPKK